LDIDDFLTPMLAFEPKKRVTAREALAHPWLNN
jgi:serine/threonine-protein kinase SRPK1